MLARWLYFNFWVRFKICRVKKSAAPKFSFLRSPLRVFGKTYFSLGNSLSSAWTVKIFFYLGDFLILKYSAQGASWALNRIHMRSPPLLPGVLPPYINYQNVGHFFDFAIYLAPFFILKFKSLYTHHKKHSEKIKKDFAMRATAVATTK